MTEETTPNFLKLSAVMRRVKAILGEHNVLANYFWVKGQLVGRNERNGNLYADLVETSDEGKIIAKIRLAILRYHYGQIRDKLAHDDYALSEGCMVGLQCCLEFHEIYGFSLKCIDADPRVMLGERERQRREIIERLRHEDLINRNASLLATDVPQRIGLITSRESAAYSDILSTIESASSRILIYIADTLMQGDNCEESILRSMDCLEHLHLDLVIIARGGGARFDLSSLDNETIARRIASYRYPVWTAIGHDNDNSILDIVANKAFRTPTAVAQEIAGRYQGAEQLIRDYYDRLNRVTTLAIDSSRSKLDPAFRLLRLGVSRYFEIKKHKLEGSAKDLDKSWDKVYSSSEQRLGLMKSELNLFSKLVIARCKDNLNDDLRQLVRLANFRIGSACETFDAIKERVRRRPALKRIMNEKRKVGGHGKRLELHANLSIAKSSESLRWISKGFNEPRMCKQLFRERHTLDTFKQRLMHVSKSSLGIHRRELFWLHGRLSIEAIVKTIERERDTLDAKALAIKNASPATALARGYSLIYSGSGDVVKSCSQVRISEPLRTELCDGVIISQVSRVEAATSD